MWSEVARKLLAPSQPASDLFSRTKACCAWNICGMGELLFFYLVHPFSCLYYLFFLSNVSIWNAVRHTCNIVERAVKP